MRLSTANIDKRARITLNRSIKTNSGLKIVEFGDKNDYPQLIEMLINSSKTGKAVSKIYSNFLSGQGFENDAINNIVIATDARGKKVTLYDLLRQTCTNLAKNNGAYIHLDLNLNKEVANPKPIPFKFCRFTATDDYKYSPKIAVYDNWERSNDTTVNRNNTFDKKNIKEYNVFNLNDAAFLSQIQNCGGIENFNGQVYFLFLDNEFLYPLSPFDSVYLDLDTEAQISIFKNNTIRNGFFDKTIFRTATQTDSDRELLTSKIHNMMGADGDNVLVIEDDINPDSGELEKNNGFVVDKIQAQISPDLFENWEKSVANSIRKVVNGLPAVLIDYEEGKLSTTSGESIIQATNFFNAMTQSERKSISQAFSEIFKNSVIPELKNNQNWNIKPLQLYQPDLKIDELELKKIEAQSTLKGSVGGITALLEIQKSVSQGVTDLNAGIEIVKEIFGFSDQTAEKILGTPKIIENDTNI